MNHWSEDYFGDKAGNQAGLTVGQFREVQLLALQVKIDRVRQEMREAIEPLPRWVRWLLVEIWPSVFYDL